MTILRNLHKDMNILWDVIRVLSICCRDKVIRTMKKESSSVGRALKDAMSALTTVRASSVSTGECAQRSSFWKLS